MIQYEVARGGSGLCRVTGMASCLGSDLIDLHPLLVGEISARSACTKREDILPWVAEVGGCHVAHEIGGRPVIVLEARRLPPKIRGYEATDFV